MFGKGNVKLDAELYARARGRAGELGYASVNEFVAHVVERELKRADEQQTKEKVLEKMKGLGYLQ